MEKIEHADSCGEYGIHLRWKTGSGDSMNFLSFVAYENGYAISFILHVSSTLSVALSKAMKPVQRVKRIEKDKFGQLFQ